MSHTPDSPTGGPDPLVPGDPAAAPEPTRPADQPAKDTKSAKPVAPGAGLNSKGRVRQTRVSALWVGLVAAAVLAIFLLIFIAQNSGKVAIKFLGFEGQISLAIALLLSAVIGILVVAVPGTLRIGQLRRALRKNAKAVSR